MLLMVELVFTLLVLSFVCCVVSGGVGVVYHFSRYLLKPFPIVLFFFRIVLFHYWVSLLLHVFWLGTTPITITL